MQDIHRELSEAIHAEGGTVQEVTGDGVMALFGAPVALEDAPLRACRAALDIQARMANFSSEIKAAQGIQPMFRVGLHSGSLIIGTVGDDQRMELTALGDTVNYASRLESVAKDGTVLMSEATQILVDGAVDSAFEGERDIKGRKEPQKVWRLLAVKKGVSRFDVSRARGLTPLIGRHQELEILERLWGEAENGQLRVVNLGGEAGIGKSRLLHEFRARLEDKSIVIEGFCADGSQAVPFLPFADIVRRSFGFTANADQNEARRRLSRGLEVLGLEPEAHLSYLLNFLGYDDGSSSRANVADEARGIRTRDAVISMLNERCRLKPTIMVIEDLHWMDQGSGALLSRILSSDKNLPLLIITTHRPDYQPPWSGQPGCTDITLKLLSRVATTDLLKARLDVDELPKALVSLVGEKAEGNPLFAEEITNYLLQSGNLIEHEQALSFAEVGQEAVLPAGLENMLMARFDRLDQAPRQVLEAAAVLGQRFEIKLIADMIGSDNDLSAQLAVLEADELVMRERGRATYRFKHALVHDAVYEGMLSSQRHELHEAAGNSIEAAKGPEAADALAYHFSQTGCIDKTIRYLALAGENSLRIYSLDEAAERLEEALGLIEQNPSAVDGSLATDVLLHIARIKYFQMEFFSLIDLVNKHLPRVEAMGDNRRLSRFLFEGGYAHVFACQIEPGRKLLARARTLGEEMDDDLSIAYADMGMMWDRMYWSEPSQERYDAQREAGERIMAVGQKHGDMWLASKGGIALGLDLMAWGNPAKSREVTTRMMEMSRDSNDPRPRTMALWARASIDAFSGNFQEAIENADEALKICLSPIDIAAAKAYKMVAAVLSGQAESSRELMAELPDVAGKGLLINATPIFMSLGVGTVMSGNMAGGMKMIEAAGRQAEDWGHTVTRPLANFFTGQTYLQMVLSEGKPPLSSILRNLPFLMRTLPFVKQKSRRHLQMALEQSRILDCASMTANCLYALGLLDLAEKRVEAAKANFKEACAIAKSVGQTGVIIDTEKALAELSAN